MTFENCIKKAAEDNVRYFGIFDYNKETNKVKCFSQLVQMEMIQVVLHGWI